MEDVRVVSVASTSWVMFLRSDALNPRKSAIQVIGILGADGRLLVEAG